MGVRVGAFFFVSCLGDGICASAGIGEGGMGGGGRDGWLVLVGCGLVYAVDKGGKSVYGWNRERRG